MPNYRKKKQSNSNNRNKNKNKNLIQNKKQCNETSSSVKQELHSEFVSVGNRPNLPADVTFSCIDTRTTSTRVLDREKGVVVVDDDSSPSSNEEIDENACNVDIDTCSSDTKTVLTQSNYSSSFCSSSSSKKLTEIERKSERTVFDGDSTFGNSVITDTFEVGAGINSLKTGSAHSKDAVVPTAVRSATRSIESTSVSEGSVNKNRLNSGGLRDESEPETERENRAKKVIVHEIVKESSVGGSSSSQISSPEVIGTDPRTITSKVVIHQISKEESPRSKTKESKQESSDRIPTSKVISQQVEESKTTSHSASKRDVDQPPKVITQQISKKKAVRSTTSSLHSVQSIDDDDRHPIASRQPGKVIEHQISKEDSQSKEPRRVSFDPIPQEISKVIVHEIAKDTILSDSSLSQSDSYFDPYSQDLSKVTTSKLLTENSSVRSITNQNVESSKDVTDQSKEVIIQPSFEANSTHISSPKVVVIPILLENSTQTTASPLATLPKSTHLPNPLESLLEQRGQTEQPVKQPNEVLIPILVEGSTQTSPHPLPPEIGEHRIPSTVFFEQISKDRTPTNITDDSPHPSLQRESTQTTQEIPTPPSRTAFPVCRSPKVIVHQIYREGSPRPVFPFTPKSLEKLDHSSKKIVNQILQDVSTELQSSFRAERENRLAKDQKPELIRTSFPLSAKGNGPIRPGFFESNLFQTESNPIQSNVSEVISQHTLKKESNKSVHQTSSESSNTSHTRFSSNTPGTFPLFIEREIWKPTLDGLSSQTQPLESKVIVHQISQEESKSTKTTVESSSLDLKSTLDNVDSTLLPETSTPASSHHNFPIFDSQDNTTLPRDLESKVISHQILRKESNSNRSTTSSKTFPLYPEGQDQATPFDSEDISALKEPEVILQQQTPSENTNTSHTRFPLNTPGEFPLFVERETWQPTSDDINLQTEALDSNVIVHKIFQEESKSTESTVESSSSDLKSSLDNVDSTLLPETSTPASSHHNFPIFDSQDNTRDLESKVISHQISREESNSNRSTTSSKTFPLYPEGQDQATPFDSEDISVLKEPEVILQQQTPSENTNTSHTRFPLNTPGEFPLFVERETWQPTSDDINLQTEALDSNVIVHKIFQEESKSTESTVESSSSDLKSSLDNVDSTLLPETSTPASSHHNFPIFDRQDNTALPRDLESKVISHQISREETNSHRSTTSSNTFPLYPEGQDQATQFDSEDISALKEPEVILQQQIPSENTNTSHTRFPLNTPGEFPLFVERETWQPTSDDINLQTEELASNVIVHKIFQEESKSTKSTVESSSSDLKSSLDNVDSTLIPETSTPASSHHNFPIFDSQDNTRDLESKVISHQISREESNSNRSTTSSKTFPLYPEGQDQATPFDSEDISVLKEPEVILQQQTPSENTNTSHTRFPLNTPGEFPLFVERETWQPTSDDINLQTEALDSNVIVHKIFQEESKSTESTVESSSSDLKSSLDNVDSTLLPETSTPASSHHNFPIFDSQDNTRDLESKVISHQISREESNSNRSTTSSKTFPLYPEGQDQATPFDSEDISALKEPEVILQQQTPSENTNTSHTRFPLNTPGEFPLFIKREIWQPTSESNVIVHKIIQEESKSTESSVESSSEQPSSTDQSESVSTSAIHEHLSRESKAHHNSFPVNSHHQLLKHKKTGESAHKKSKVIIHQISREEPSDIQSSCPTKQFPLSNHKKKIHESPPSKEEIKSRAIVHQVLRQQTKSSQSSAYQLKDQVSGPNTGDPFPSGTSEKSTSSFPVFTGKRDQSTQFDSTTQIDLEPKVIIHPIQSEGPEPSQASDRPTKSDIIQSIDSDVGKPQSSETSSPVNSQQNVAESTSEGIISSSKDLSSKVIVHQILLEESNSNPDITSSTEPEVIQQQIPDSPNSTKSTVPSTSSDLKRSDQTIPSDSASKSSLDEISTPTVSTESKSTSPLSDMPLKPIDHQTSQDESVSSSSSSGESVLTAIQVDSTKSTSPPVIEEKVDVQSPRSSFFITNAEISQQTKSDKSDSSDTETLRGESGTSSEHEEDMSSPSPSDQSSKETIEQTSQDLPTALPTEVTSPKIINHPIVKEKTPPPSTERVIIHPIVREIFTDKPPAYRVESPQPDRRLMIVKKSKSFDDDDIVIQEMSDNSSAGDTDNPPVISEAESETDTLEAIDDFPDTPINSRVLSVQTLPIDHEDDTTTPMSPKSTQDYKIRRQQNRAALESHFFPQFLSPLFLDSIKEENSDLSDSERRSECSDRTDHATQQDDLEDDVFLEGGPHAKKADAVFPKSNLDFSKKHKHGQTNVRPPKTSIIREEAPAPSVVEAKIIDQGSIEECVSSWSADLTPQSEDAEVVYIDSASSSVSDLLELDYSQGQPDDSIDVRIQTPTIDLESVNEMFAYRPSESNEPPHSTSPPPLPPVKEEKNISETILSPPLTDRVATTNTLPSEITTTQTAVEQKIPHDEIILEKIETMSEAAVGAASVVADDRNNGDDVAAAAADRAQNSKANNPNSCDSAINEVVTNDTPSVAVGNIGKMENLREIVSAAAVQSELDTITDTDTDTDRGIMKPNFKIGEPCSDHTFQCDTRTTTTSSSVSSASSSSSTTTTTTSTTSGTQILTLHDLSKTLGDTQHLHPLGSTSSNLDRQESLDSHGSDQSQSTNQSQCTAINQGSLPHCDWNEFDTTTDTTYVSGSDTAGLASSENSSPLTTGGGRSGDDTESPPIRKLRSLCTEALASMPYGAEVLEELATVAHNIGDMPYPLPEIPHIQDIQVSLRSDPQTTSVITLAQVPPTSTPVGQKLRSPPPPPVPEPPSKYESWLGVPTESDPSVLVCLSPSQRTAVKTDSTADSLLDMHKKFVERRGYHEYTTKQVNAMNRENSQETVKLSKTTSPPPPPLPPRPQVPPAHQSSNGNETATDINADDQNNHRLLAIIRDTHETQQQHHQQRSENISRRTESGANTTNSSTTTTTTANGGGGQEEFAKNSPSVSKQTQEQQFVSESNQSQSTHHEMQTGQTERTIKVDREPILGLRFPTSDYFDSIFDDKPKRFSNIETASSPGFCSQILNTQPKRYSNIETSSFESRKCVENGKVLYDVTDSNRQTVREGEKPEPAGPTAFPELRTKVNNATGFPYVSSSASPQVNPQQSKTGDSESIMSAFKLNTQTTAPPAPPPVPAQRVESSPPAPPVPPLPPTLADTTATTTTTTKSTSKSESVINRNFNGETKETIFDDFRQRAKEAAAGEQHSTVGGAKKSDVFDHEKLLKDFDELSNLLKDELESGKRRPPATLDGSQIPAAVSDYNRVARESKTQSSHMSSTTSSESTRREQMKKLADEIDRTSAQRLQHRKEMRIPIRIEKPTPTPPRSAPVQMENGTQAQRTFEIPVRIENGADTQRQSLHHQRSYEIPIRVEHQTGARQRTRSEHQSNLRSHEAPIRVERPPEQPERFRRAESMFNISDTTSGRHLLHDDWMKYVGDLGSSENICKPFQREVEICYLGRRPNIRAPRLSASTSDLSSTQSYDTYGAYDVRRTTTTQTPIPQQPPRRRFLSTQSMIDTTPITSCVSSRRSPVPERRSSLPREIHDQQLKYISSKEQQLQIEFERLENERRQLIDEMNRAQINQRMNREAYRQRQLPPLTEDESIRQQMAEEWLNKVAEREERRLQKIIKISKINQDANFPTAPPRRVSSSDIGDEFLRRVKERRSKLCMPSDSDWESGAESQPVPRTDGSRSENDEPPATVLEGQAEADYHHLPKHLREFAKLTSQQKEEHHEETTENTSCSAIKKSSVVTTVKTTSSNNANNANNNYFQQNSTQEPTTQSHPESLQQDAARVRDLEQLSQGKRQKLVTILRHKKPAESGSAGGCQQSVAVAVAAGPSGAGGANSVKRRKQTRFLLTPNRRSWSESDLLREIDKELVLAKGFLYANGVWTPKNQTPSSSRTNLNEYQPYNHTSSSDKISENRSSSACGPIRQKGIPTPPPPPLWTPQPERKQFRPVHFESPKLQRKYVRQQSTPSEAPPPPWSYTNSQPFPGYQSQSCTNLSQKNTAIPWPPPPAAAAAAAPSQQNGSTVIVDESVVDDVDDDGFAPTTSIAEKIRSFERSTSNSELHRPYVRHNPHEKPAILRPNEVIYSLKNEYMSEPETEYDKPKKMAQLSRRQYDGIGPTTRDGMPVVLRSEVKEPNQHEWYKRIFQTIHKQKNPDDYVTIRYKCPRGRYPYKSNGYMSEPEPNYDSDYSTVKYRTLERRRLQSTTASGTGSAPVTGPSSGILRNDSHDDTVYGTMPNPVKSGQGSYKVQPGRIEDYITGHSSVSEKEKKEWWDEVMDIFNGWLKDNATLPRVFIDFANEVERFQFDQQKLSPHYTEGNLSRALLKEQGYTSDSNLVFRKKDVPQHQSPLSPVEQKQFYKSVQSGGQPPLLGFRKPAPEKPKETEFEYLPITPTLTKIRVHSKEAMSKKSQTTHAAQRELICYPITNLSRPIDMFAPFPKHVPSFIPMNQPPLPPNRKSSRTRTTSMALRISSSDVRRPTSANSSRHEACFQTKDAMSPPPPRPTKYGTITLKKTVKRTEPLLRSKSAGAVVSVLSAAKEEKTKDGRVSRKQQSIRLSSCSPVRSASRVSTLRTSSRSPVAFGRSVSKERSFAEEKKRIEETMPSIRTDFTASTNILRDPKLKSPDQVKRAVRSYAYPIERSKSAPRVLSPAKPVTSSYMSTYVVRRVASPSRKDVPPASKFSSSIRSSVRTPVVTRSKSQSSKLSSTSKPMTKTSSTVSLARTSSTFSVDSVASKVKTIPKKPLTITRPSVRPETEKAKRKPVTISSSKSDSNVLRKIKESAGAKEKIVKAIPSQQKLIRTNQFFTNLFMRDSPSKNDPVQQASVHEKARYWNTMSLPHQKSVSDSRHLSYQQCRSLSPPARPHYVEEYESVEHFHSDDEASEFGDRSARTEDLVWQYEQRSRSEPRTARPISDIARPQSPAPVFPREFSPTREIRVPQTREMRSPSRRRIQSFRGSQRGETDKVIRASSLSSADDRAKKSIYHCDEISHSANSLEYIERHSPSCRFKNSDRFIDLNRFYSTLERVGQLERATSATSLKPIRREGEAMDFEEWRKLRFHERAERELNYLVGRLKEDQKQKDFLFRPKDVEDVKWSGNKDLALRSKDKSVEDLRENFEKKIHQEWLDETKRLELESRKDTHKPYWRGSSVADLASSMEIKYNPDSGSFGVQKLKSESSTEKPLCLSNRLISTLSKDQVSKITQQLNEIYNASEPKTKPDVTEEYVITVDKQTPASALKVRCNSSISKEELIGPVLRRKEASGKPAQSKTFDRLSQEVRKFESELSETEKRRLSQTFSREIQGKTRSGSPVMLARETRGAIAAENAKSTLPDIPPPPPLPKDLLEIKKPAPAKPKRKTFDEQKQSMDEDSLKIETISTQTLEKPDDNTVSNKIQYFEDRQFEEPSKTIYHAREDSSPDEDEVMRVIEENIKARAESQRFQHKELTSSVTDLKDLYGEKESSRINFPLPRPPPPPDETVYHETKQNQHRSASLTLSQSRDDSLENLEAIFRSRSISPQPTGSSYLHRVHTGEVRKIKDKFESLGRPKKKKSFFALSPLRKVRSDPELSNDGSKDTFKTVVRENEIGDVSWITHKFEVRNSAVRGRSRFRKPGSPIQRMPLRKEDRLMPHIDIISKTASLKQEMMKSRSPSPVRQQATLHAGEVERIRCIFETSPDRESLLGQPHLGTSSPELRDISTHLTASWIAHKYPKPLDNDIRSPPPPVHEKSVSLPAKQPKRQERPYRSRSISPPKAKQKSPPVISILKPRYDFFANQKFDPSIHRPKARYVPDSGDDIAKKLPPPGAKRVTAVKFKGRKPFADEDELEEWLGTSRIL